MEGFLEVSINGSDVIDSKKYLGSMQSVALAVTLKVAPDMFTSHQITRRC